ncbi:hypothetical protein BC938DRAFT_483044 [Jimgerdemannia flammicorona]|uniref:Thioredoxin domain-containing protein n=1 Tax=Jimgerdemannia flammicorona TaxID=994334 RepID=A0A433QCP2_9FUNG|nr:hypothetical protein BC938DRAFT_483044 [Jimgerdemannia flammicorona]
MTDLLCVIPFAVFQCIPCRDAITHLTELNKKHGGKVHIISITWETDQKNRSYILRQTVLISFHRNHQVVEDFVSAQGDMMEFTVALDSLPHIHPFILRHVNSRTTYSLHTAMTVILTPCKFPGIPYAFIVVNNVILHQFDPTQPIFETTLAAVVEDVFSKDE